MDDYLSKPIKQADLKAMIEKWTSMNIQESNNTVQSISSTTHQVIDPKRIAEIIELGDESLLLELLALFLADGKISINEIETSLKTNDAVLLRESSHKLKGSSANLGISALQQICSSIEDFARNNEIENSRPFLQPLLKEFEIVQQYIRKTYSV